VYVQNVVEPYQGKCVQAQLLDSLYGVERGLQASGEVKAEIGELIVKLEANNPTPSPNQVTAPILGHCWAMYAFLVPLSSVACIVSGRHCQTWVAILGRTSPI